MIGVLREVTHYSSALVGLAIIAGLVGLALYGVFAIPYNEAVRLWRGAEGVRIENPRNAQPAWVNLFRGRKLPSTISWTADKLTQSRWKLYRTQSPACRSAWSSITLMMIFLAS